MLYQIADGLNYLHEKNIIHRDLKCENILINQDNKCQIADFGFARKMEEDSISSTFCGSAAYAAPELLKGTNQTERILYKKTYRKNVQLICFRRLVIRRHILCNVNP